MSQIGNNIYPNTTFPDAVQQLPNFTDLSAADQTNYIKYLQQILAGNMTGANDYLNLITDTAIINANKLNILSDTIRAIQDVYNGTETFTNIIEEKQSEWEELINRFKYDGVWQQPEVYNPSKTYNRENLVLYNNKIWYCKLDNTTSNILPAENNNWTQYYFKNSMVRYTDSVSNRAMLYLAVQDISTITDPYTSSQSESPQWLRLTIVGAKGANGAQFNFWSSWDSAQEYSVGNLVEYNGDAYMSLVNSNINHEPTDTNYWAQQFITSMKNIPIQSDEPTGMKEGDLWFRLLI